MTLKNSPEIIANKVIRYLDSHPGCHAAAVYLCPETGSNHVVCGQRKTTRDRSFGADTGPSQYDQYDGDYALIGHYTRDVEPDLIVDDIIWFASGN